MELERSMGADLSMLQPPRLPNPTGRSAHGGSVTAASKQPASLLLSAAVQGMLMIRKGKVIEKPPRSLRLPLSSSSAERRRAVAADAEPAERAAKDVLSAARMRQVLAERVARRMLKRGAPSPEERRVVLTCCCPRLPPGLRCALHQGAPGRSWMRVQRTGGAPGAGEAVAPRACGRGGLVVSEYAPWRRSVWLPSRFYLERVVDQEDDQAA